MSGGGEAAGMGKICKGVDCIELEVRGSGYCRDCGRRRQGMSPESKRSQSHDSLVLEAVLAVSSANSEPDGDVAFHRAWARLRYITARWHGIPAADLHRPRRAARKRVLQDA